MVDIKINYQMVLRSLMVYANECYQLKIDFYVFIHQEGKPQNPFESATIKLSVDVKNVKNRQADVQRTSEKMQKS